MNVNLCGFDRPEENHFQRQKAGMYATLPSGQHQFLMQPTNQNQNKSRKNTQK